MFLHNLARGEAYRQEAPTLWDVTFRTAVAQAELEDRERPGAYHRIALLRAARASVYIETTRPELLPACVALVAHPDDERYQPLFGTTVRTPLFDVEVPVVAHHLAEPDKGSGIAMICTFGDLNDVIWWRELQLPTRPIVGWDGRILRRPAAAACPARRLRRAGRQDRVQRAAADRRAAARVGRPRRRAEADHPPGEVLREGRASRSRSSPRASGTSGTAAATTTCATPSSRAAGRSTGCPTHMRDRYENWVEGLNGDWLISRQRFFGVPFPVWYPLDADGEPDYDDPILPPRRRCRSTRRPTPPPASPRPSATSPAASSATPTSWTPGRRPPCRRRSRRGWIRDPELFARRLPDGPAAAGARHHPHLAVLHRRPLALRVRRGAVDARGDLRLHRSTPTARRCRSRRATRRRRSTSSSSTAPTRSAGGPPERGRAPTRLRRDADEDRPPAGDQDPQRGKFVLGLGGGEGGGGEVLVGEGVGWGEWEGVGWCGAVGCSRVRCRGGGGEAAGAPRAWPGVRAAQRW